MILKTLEERENRDLLSKCFSILYKIRKWSRLDYDVTSKKCRDSFLKEFKGIDLSHQENCASLKQAVIFSMGTNKDKWTEEDIKTHGEEMFKLLEEF